MNRSDWQVSILFQVLIANILADGSIIARNLGYLTFAIILAVPAVLLSVTGMGCLGYWLHLVWKEK